MAAEPEFNFLPVREVNWANPNVNRASIVPIASDKNYRWIGLGINNFGTTITTIGGGYEKVDHDLLSTAVREWNEEMGANTPSGRALHETDLYDRYAIQFRNFIVILLPMRKITQFKPTDEIHTLLWVTPEQLRAMNANQQTPLPREKMEDKTGIRAYLFSKDLAVVADGLAAVVEKEDISVEGLIKSFDLSLAPFDISLIPFDRPPKEVVKVEPRVIYSTQEFVDEINPSWHAVALIKTPHYMTVYRSNQIVYKLPLKDIPTIAGQIERNKVRMLVALKEDLKSVGFNRKNMIIIEDRLRSLKLQPELSDFLDEIQKARQLDEDLRIEAEAKSVFEYEYIVYQRLEKTKRTFNFHRVCFLKTLNLINLKLSQTKVSMTYLDIIGAITPFYKSFCSKSVAFMNLYLMVSLMIANGVLQQDPISTIITVP